MRNGAIVCWFSLIRQRQIFPPDLTECGVTGVMRNYVMQLAKQLQLPVKIGQYSTEDLRTADEIFITNSVHGIWPVRQIDQFDFKAGPVTKQLMDEMV